MLVSLRVKKPDASGLYDLGSKRVELEEKPRQRNMTRLEMSKRPGEARYTTRFAVVAGVGFEYLSDGEVEVQMGEYTFRPQGKHTWRAGQRNDGRFSGGQATFQAPHDAEDNQQAPGVCRMTKGSEPLALPIEASERPDVFLYITEAKTDVVSSILGGGLGGGGKGDRRRKFFKRFSAKEVDGTDFSPRWVTLTPCVPDGAEPKPESRLPPSLLVSLRIAPLNNEGSSASGAPWAPSIVEMPKRTDLEACAPPSTPRLAT